MIIFTVAGWISTKFGDQEWLPNSFCGCSSVTIPSTYHRAAI